MPPVGFESTISAGERPQNHALDWEQQIKLGPMFRVPLERFEVCAAVC